MERNTKPLSLLKSLLKGHLALINLLKLPLRHRKAVRRTNLIERSFEEERRRTKVIGGFLTEKSALKVIFTTLIKAERRWKRIPMGERDGGCKCLIIKLSLFYRKNGT